MHSSVKDSNKNAPALFMQRYAIQWVHGVWHIGGCTLSFYRCVCVDVCVADYSGCMLFCYPLSSSLHRPTHSRVYLELFECNFVPCTLRGTHTHTFANPFFVKIAAVSSSAVAIARLLISDPVDCNSMAKVSNTPGLLGWGFFERCCRCYRIQF